MKEQPKSLEEKTKKDRADYETLCRLSGTYPMHLSVNWYWHFNELKSKLISRVSGEPPKPETPKADEYKE